MTMRVVLTHDIRLFVAKAFILVRRAVSVGFGRDMQPFGGRTLVLNGGTRRWFLFEDAAEDLGVLASVTAWSARSYWSKN